MPKQLFNFSPRVLPALMLCLCLFAACENPADSKPAEDGGETEKTWVEFTNLELFPVTVYRDPQRQQKMAEVAANGWQKIPASPTPAGTAFYPTFHLNFSVMPGISIPYDQPAIITVIKADITNVEVNAYLRSSL